MYPLCPVTNAFIGFSKVISRQKTHTTHGGLPDAHSFSRYSRSRCVSRQAQKPRCLKIDNCPSRASLTSGSRSSTHDSSADRYGRKLQWKKKNPPLIQLSAKSGFSANSCTCGPSTLSSPNREGGLTPRTVP